MVAAIGSVAGIPTPVANLPQGNQFERGREVADALKMGATAVMQDPTEQHAIATLDGVSKRYGIPAEHFDAGKAAIYATKNDPDQIRKLMGGLGEKADQALAQIGGSQNSPLYGGM